LRADFFPEGKAVRNLSIKAEVENIFTQNDAFTAYDTETSTRGYSLLNAGLSADIVSNKKVIASIFLNALNITDVSYQNHLSRLKYSAENIITGRRGVFGMGRNFSVKINIPISFIDN